MKIKNKIIIVLFFSIFAFSSCEKYLDIVPDGTQELSLLFNRKETAYNALANCYSYLPQNDGTYASYALLSDELAVPVPKEPNAIRVMKGQQTVSNPLMGYWSGFSATGKGQGSLWEGIRSCNILNENIDLVLFPNSVVKGENLNVQINGGLSSEETIEVVVLDSFGRVVIEPTTKRSSEFEIATNNLVGNSIYILSVTTENKTIVKRFIVE